jgi:hypothetical protein
MKLVGVRPVSRDPQSRRRRFVCGTDATTPQSPLVPGSRVYRAPEVADGVWSIYIVTVVLGRLDERTYTIHG